jgi:hypothetical protein
MFRTEAGELSSVPGVEAMRRAIRQKGREE